MKTIILLILLLCLVYITGCGARVPGNIDSSTHKRYMELKDTDPKDL